MGIVDPTGFSKLTDIMNSVGNGAGAMLKNRNPGVKDVAGAFGQMQNQPNMAVGGMEFPSGNLRESIGQMLPSAERSLYQAEPARRMGLAGIEGGVSELGSTSDLMGQGYREKLMKMLQDFGYNVGFSPSQSTTGSGAGGLLMRLLSSI